MLLQEWRFWRIIQWIWIWICTSRWLWAKRVWSNNMWWRWWTLIFSYFFWPYAKNILKPILDFTLLSFEDIYVNKNTFFYFNLNVFSLVLHKFLLFNSKQFGNLFEKNTNLSKLEKTIPCGQVLWFCLVVLNLSFYRFEKKNITSIWSAKFAKFLKKSQPRK